ncbi:DUF1232 domain-containing protein [Sinorhizobium meliloti]|nr:DUF1232 domain-containing protein [Sinorhizobium meliloti]
MEKWTSMASKFRSRITSSAALLPSAERVARTIKRATSRIPFIDDVLAMYYCAIDPKTPVKVRVVIGATLLYLVMPVDAIPDFLAMVGYSDDITALMVLVKLVSAHVTDTHRQKAQSRLDALCGHPAETASA